MNKESKDMKKQYLNLVDCITTIINDWDPLGLIAFGAPKDEYDLEINYFLPKMVHASESEYVSILHETFSKYFGTTYTASIEDEKEVTKKISEAIRTQKSLTTMLLL
jgi:hypothetical protein